MGFRFTPHGCAAGILCGLALSPSVAVAEFSDAQCEVLRNAARANLELNRAVTQQIPVFMLQGTRILTVRALLAQQGKHLDKKGDDEIVGATDGIKTAVDALSHASDAAVEPTRALVGLVVASCPAKP